MTKSEKIAFVRQLADSIRDSLVQAISDDRIPADWNGFELRQLLADRTAAQAFNLAPALKRAYNKTVRERQLGA